MRHAVRSESTDARMVMAGQVDDFDWWMGNCQRINLEFNLAETKDKDEGM